MNEDCLKLTTYFGERDRAGDRFLADALLDLYGRAGVQVSVLLRGTEGFGAHHRLHTQRVLTLSEDLPVVAVAVDARERIEHLADEVRAVSTRGLVTLERARMLTGRTGGIELDGPAKLTVYVGRKERLDGEPAYRGVVALLRRHGVDGATVLLGVDGTARGVRRRARFFGGNVDVPLMIIAVGGGEAVAAAAGELSMRLARPLMTLERVRVCKRDGALLAEPHDLASGGDWQKLTVYAGETLYTELVRGLRAAGASGATALRGIWGYHGDHAPHGERFWSLRRHVGVMTVVVDAPERIRRAFAIIDQLTAQSGLVTSEVVPARPVASAAGDR